MSTPKFVKGTFLTALSVAVLVAGWQVPAASPSQAAPFDKPKVERVPSVPVSDVDAKARPDVSREHARAAARSRAVKPVVWPRAGTVSESGAADARRAASDSPVQLTVAKRSGRSASPSLKVLGRKAPAAAGIDGLLVVPQGTTASDRAKFTVDYAGFAHAFGADYGGRLVATAYPACLLTTPKKKECSQPTALPSVNDADKGTLTVELSKARTSSVVAIAAASASAAGTGDFKATSFSESSTWSAGGSDGGFSWSYPLTVPPGLGGPTPDLKISYSSQSADGRTPSSNNQSSWVGDGFELNSSFIERKYVSCSEDGIATKYDLCWKTDNASMVLNGQANELVKVDADTWRLKSDDGTRVRRLQNAEGTNTIPTNGDANDERWEVTTPNGVTYHFGKTAVPGQTGNTNSVWTVPVRGNNTGEPCYNATHTLAFCNQAWRWNLDYVEDPSGNAMSYWYTAETNHYAKNAVASPGTAYTRGGYLTRIDYGLRAGQSNPTPPMQVLFTSAIRCLAPSDPNLSCNDYSKTLWPDVPYDQICNSSEACTGKLSPTFFTRMRLTKVTTQIREGGAYQPVAGWNFKHDFLDNGASTSEGIDSLWPTSITKQGLRDGTITLPKVILEAAQMKNRVDTASDGISSLPRWRLRRITSEAGSQTVVNYSGTACPVPKPTPDNNTDRCFPQKWTPPQATIERTDWFHKYVVESVSRVDTMTNSPAVTTYYDYIGGGAWRYNDDPLVPQKYRTWSQWRGFGKVRTTTGQSDLTDAQSVSEATYFRGMDGNRKEDGSPRPASVSDSQGNSHQDLDRFAGFQLESRTLNGAGALNKGVITVPWSHLTAGSGTQGAYYVAVASEHSRSAHSSGTHRERLVQTTYSDVTGLPERVSDFGDLAVSNDQICTATQYVHNRTATGPWILAVPSRVVRSKGVCGSGALAPSETEVLSDVRTSYDSKSFGETPTRGLPTKTERLREYLAGVPTYQEMSSGTYDAYGRSITATAPAGDGLSLHTTTEYMPTADGTIGQVVTTQDPATKAFTTTETLDPAFGTPKKSVDLNNKVTEQTYDALGRLTQVWLPNRQRAQAETPNMKFGYGVTGTSAPWISSSTIKPDASGYNTSYQIFDSLYRPRQGQAPSPSGGRAISGTVYDGRGLATETDADIYNNASGPTGTFVQFEPGEVPARTETTYDALQRPTKSSFSVHLEHKWDTITTYAGNNKVTVDKPNGAPTVTQLTDVRGQLVERTEHGSPNLDTTYQYDLNGQMTRLVGRAATWTWKYDLRGRKVEANDPDSGITKTEYTDTDLPRVVEDAAGQQLRSTYDKFGRQTGLYKGAGTAAADQLVGWTFDADAVEGGKGKPYTTTRYVGGADGLAMTDTVTAYSPLGDPLDTSFKLTNTTGTIAAGLPTTGFPTSRYINPGDGSVTKAYLPKVSNASGTALSTEIVNYGYNGLGMPTNVTGLTGIVGATVYDELGRVGQYEVGRGDEARLFVNNDFEQGTNRVERTLAVTNTSENVVADHHYTYDAAGNIVKDANTGIPGGDVQCFDYDDHQRLAQAWTPASKDCSTAPSEGALGGAAPYWQKWTYDAEGRRLSEKDARPGSSTTTNYAYPPAGAAHPHAITSTTTVGGASSAYDYNDLGQTTTRPNADGAGTQTLTWDVLGKLSSVKNNATEKTTEHIYGVDGELLLTADAEEQILYLGETEIRRDKSTGVLTAKRHYSTHLGTVATRSSDTQIDFFLADRHGSAEVTLDGQTLTPTRRFLTPYGEDRSAAPVADWPNNQVFLGKPHDLATGLTSVGARMYDAKLGSFISVDPILVATDPKSLLGYAYSGHNPISFSDPTGLERYCGDSACPTADSGNSGGDGDSAGVGSGMSRGDGTIGMTTSTSSSGGGDGGDDDGGFSLGGLKDKAVGGLKGTRNLLGGMVSGTAAAVDFGGNCATPTIVVTCPLYIFGYSNPYNASWGADKLNGLIGTDTGSRPYTWGEWIGLPLPGIGAAGAGARLGARTGSRFSKLLTGNIRRLFPKAKPVPSAAGHACSFSGATLVLMGDGSKKRIEDVEVGDKVIATDPETGERRSNEVTHVWVHDDTLVGLDLDGDIIDTTEDHPFWSVSDQRFERADELNAGEQVLGADGHLRTVSGLALGTARRATAYNLTVEGVHTYHVGSNEILVHNVCPPAPSGPLSPNQMNAAIKRGAAPAGIRRVDTGKIPGEQTHVHFSDKSALNIDGSWKHGRTTVTRGQRRWLEENGWVVPDE